MRPVKLAALTVLSLVAACDVPPESTDVAFRWQESVQDIDDAFLGACTSDGVLFAVGGRHDSGAVYRLTAGRWRQEAGDLNGQRLWSCWAGPRQAIIAVGQTGAIFQHSLEGWYRATVPDEVKTAKLYSVWGLSDGTAVAVGGGLAGPRAEPVILHFDGQAWTRADTSRIVARNLWAVWGYAADDYWAVGDDGMIAHFDGEQWAPVSSRVDDRLKGIIGVGPDEIYAVGGTGRGIILRWNGSSWVQFDETTSSLNTVWTRAGASLFVGGEEGFLARFRRRDTLPRPELIDVNQSFTHLRVQTLLGLGQAVFAAASSIALGDDGDWRGAVLGHKRSFAGLVVEDSRQPDAGVGDAGLRDAAADANGFQDAQGPDGSLTGFEASKPASF